MNGKLLPADTYIVVNKTILSLEDRKKITMLYQPIIGHTAVSLYFSLIDDLEKSEFMSSEFTHHHLVLNMQLKLNDIIIAREKLEAVGLLKTYIKEGDINNFVYVLYSPLSVNDFFSHPILSIALYNNLGKKEFDKLINYFKVPRLNLKDYKDITSNFSSVFDIDKRHNIVIDNDNVIKRNAGVVSLDDKVDFDLLISSIPKKIVGDKCFNDETKELINALSFTYNIDNLNMQGLVRDSINEKGLIDKNELIKQARNFYQFDNGGRLPTLIYSKQDDYLKDPPKNATNREKMIYIFKNVTPLDYLRSKYKTGEPPLSEVQIIEDLLVNQKMKPWVVNVLIYYVLRINNNKFTKGYVEKIASQWLRLNIETVEDAMEVCKSEQHKKLKKKEDDKKENKSDNLPGWFEKDIEKQEITEEEQEELDRLLKDF